MGTLPVVFNNILIQIRINLLTECESVKLIEHGLMKSFAYPIRLRAFDPCLGMGDLIELQVQLIRMSIW